LAAPEPSNLVARRVIDDLVDFNGETDVPKNLIAQLNEMIAEIEAMEDQKEVYDSLICLKEDKRGENNKLMALNDLIA
nr:hypothetical protein [Tanacetum cinerariifolium]